MMISLLASAGNSPLHVCRMPCTDTSHLSQPLVCLSRKLLGSPSACDALEARTLRDSDTVDHLILLEDCANLNWFLEQAMCEFDLVSDFATIHLDLHEMSLLLL